MPFSDHGAKQAVRAKLKDDVDQMFPKAEERK